MTTRDGYIIVNGRALIWYAAALTAVVIWFAGATCGYQIRDEKCAQDVIARSQSAGEGE